LENIPGMEYTMINVGEGTGGGMIKKPKEQSNSGAALMNGENSNNSRRCHAIYDAYDSQGL